jgi:hypothetical protein
MVARWRRWRTLDNGFFSRQLRRWTSRKAEVFRAECKDFPCLALALDLRRMEDRELVAFAITGCSLTTRK